MRIMPVALLALVGLTGCARQGGIARVDDQRQPVNRWTIETMDDESVANAVIAQHTLYPYHFNVGSADLNELGERDVKILARHYSRYPGEVNLRRGGESPDLYESRVQSVNRSMVAMGVAPATLKVVDTMPGGDGVSGERALLILRRSMTAAATEGGSEDTTRNDSGDRSDRNNSSTNNRGTQR